MGVLRLPQMNHLVMLGIRPFRVQTVGIVLVVGKNMAEHRYRGIAFPAEQTVHGGWHVDNGVRPWCSEKEREEIHNSGALRLNDK